MPAFKFNQKCLTVAFCALVALRGTVMNVWNLSCKERAVSLREKRSRENSSRGTTVFNATYMPAPIEKYVLTNAHELGYDPPGLCTIFHNESASSIYNDLHVYIKELAEYGELFESFTLGVTDLRLHFDDEEDVGTASQWLERSLQEQAALLGFVWLR